MNQQLADVMINKGRPIPGQGLTTDPDSPAPYEKPPEYTTVHEASEFIFGKLIERDFYIPLMRGLADEMPIMDVVQTILFKGFTEGKWTPDLLMMLLEPVTYMILALAERAGIDPVIYRGEEEDEAEDEMLFSDRLEQKKVDRIKKLMNRGAVPGNELSPEMQAQIEELPTVEDGVLEEEVAPETEANSLLSMPEEEQV